MQSGYKEYLLCPNCEKILNQFETIFKREWIDSGVMESLKSGNQDVRLESYREHRLFHLSVLFRASCSQDEAFREVKLDPVNYEKVRLLLLQSRLPRENDYPVICASLSLEGAPADEFIGPPHCIRFGPWRAYYFTFAACQWVYFGPAVVLPKHLQGGLTEGGTFRVVQREWMAFDYYRKLFDLQRMRSISDTV